MPHRTWVDLFALDLIYPDIVIATVVIGHTNHDLRKSICFYVVLNFVEL